MKLQIESVCPLALLGLCCVLLSVRHADSTFVPGRCLCPETQSGVRGQLKELTVYPKSASCHKVTVIVMLKSNGETRCLNPDTGLGKQLVRCWNRVHKMGLDAKLCLKRRRRRGRGGQRQRSRQRSRAQSRNTSV
ncbi:C-X-C motif chemokine 10-like [Halichoeres trimaculatus]|uniref:C-X-C motif chemokine 10-like n=1 Tax=Halichoeres trimaculatus TaxID=147232 RepID=UPI003D9E59EC